MEECATVERYYDDNVLDEWQRMERHPIEFEITKRIIMRHIGPAPAKILDIGGGPGRYSLWLASQGYEVTLLDLSRGNVEFARSRAGEAGVELAGCVAGNALELDACFGEGAFDHVLLMGPLYHLVDEADRRRAVEQALRVLGKGGVLVASFISAYAPIIDALKNCPEALKGAVEEHLRYLEDGRNIVSEDNPGFTSAYFIDPSAIDGFMAGFPLKRLALYTAESVLGPYEKRLREADRETFEACLDLAMRLAEDEHCRASGEHLVYVGRKEEGRD